MLELGRVRLRDLAGFSVFDGGSRTSALSARTPILNANAPDPGAPMLRRVACPTRATKRLCEGPELG